MKRILIIWLLIIFVTVIIYLIIDKPETKNYNQGTQGERMDRMINEMVDLVADDKISEAIEKYEQIHIEIVQWDKEINQYGNWLYLCRDLK